MKEKIENALSGIEDCLLCAAEIDTLKDKSIALCAIDDAMDILTGIMNEVEEYLNDEEVKNE